MTEELRRFVRGGGGILFPLQLQLICPFLPRQIHPLICFCHLLLIPSYLPSSPLHLSSINLPYLKPNRLVCSLECGDNTATACLSPSSTDELPPSEVLPHHHLRPPKSNTLQTTPNLHFTNNRQALLLIE